LHKTLEAYPVPKSLHDKYPKRISPIFRDITELTAHHSLSEKIKDAVMGSRFLIVLCSPASKQSHWVNEEIKLFRKLHGEGSILCALIEGTPETSFPPALLEGGREPLAANLNAKNFRLGVSQLAASILGVGLDALIQRDVKQRRNRMRLMMAGSFLFAGIMGVMAWNAVDARDEAETSRAEAEKMVEYMLTDLKDDLEPIGKLDLFEKVGAQVTTYYDAIPIADMDDDRLARRARAKQLLGQVAIVQGNSVKALEELHQVEKVTVELLNRMPNDPDAISTHAQSQYALARAYLTEEPQTALKYGKAYKHLSQRLYEMDNDNVDYLSEYVWATNQLGLTYQTVKQYDNAEDQFLEAVSKCEQNLIKLQYNKDIVLRLIILQRNLALIDYHRGNYKKAIFSLNTQVEKINELLLDDGENAEYLDALYLTKIWVQNIAISKLKKCEARKIYSLASELDVMINYDPDSQYWKLDFINLIHTVLKNCPPIFDQKWTTTAIDRVSQLSLTFTEKNEKLNKQIIWLENYPGK